MTVGVGAFQTLFSSLYSKPRHSVLILLQLYSIPRTICRPTVPTVGRQQTEIQTRDGRIYCTGGRYTNHYRPPHLTVDHTPHICRPPHLTVDHTPHIDHHTSQYCRPPHLTTPHSKYSAMSPGKNVWLWAAWTIKSFWQININGMVLLIKAK